MEPLVLKNSCDNCTKAKVKCSSEDPCKRCNDRGLSCFFSPKKKRGATKKRVRSTLIMEPIARRGIDPNAHLGNLGTHERRSWSVFFTLYKHYGASCSLFWFNRQLNKMRYYLERQGNKDALRRLTAWMEALSIDVDDLAMQVERCTIMMKKEAQRATMLHLNVEGKVVSEAENEMKSQVRELLTEQASKDESSPFIKITTGYSVNEDNTKVETNSAFDRMFGNTGEQLENQLKWTGGGFLPWGGDVLSRLLTAESDLLAYVQILAIKFNALGRPDRIPIVREVPSCHIFDVNLKSPRDDGTFVATKSLIKVVHREVLSEERSYLEIFMSFTPLVNTNPSPLPPPPPQPKIVETLVFDSPTRVDVFPVLGIRKRDEIEEEDQQIDIILPEADDHKLGGIDLSKTATMEELQQQPPSRTNEPSVSSSIPKPAPVKFEQALSPAKAPMSPQESDTSTSIDEGQIDNLHLPLMDESEFDVDEDDSNAESPERELSTLDGQWLDELLDWASTEVA